MTQAGGPALRVFHRKRKPLRNFIYVSDTKLDNLFEQIDPNLRRRISAEAKIDLKLASVTLGQKSPPQATRMAKLALVEHYIDKNHHVGTCSTPGTGYFRGSIPMQWGWLNPHQGPDDDSKRDTVFFRGDSESHSVILAGSRRHVLGERPAKENRDLVAGSAMPNIMAVIRENLAPDPKFGVGRRNDERLLHEAMEIPLGGPAQHLEFLAMAIVQGTVGYEPVIHSVIIGTPIYVAMAEDHDAGEQT
ncbi:hypothetical protein GCM10009760_36030 [Kitasatospora kazusensis]|uniref:Uncharacterized protein n=1 Tax=Kitasatospora kazusensis TaxID=407974 RepID=A0ABP5LH57_9ACTN